MTARILIVDDQPLIRQAVRALLAGEPDLDVIDEAGDGLRAVELAARLIPDVVLMDIRMPGVDGIEATRRIAADPALAEVRGDGWAMDGSTGAVAPGPLDAPPVLWFISRVMNH